MRKVMFAAALGLAAVTGTTAGADPVIDGTRDAAYGAADARATYSPVAPTSNFGTPTALVDQTSYNIYLTSGANNVFGFVEALGDGPNGLNVPVFANLYFALNGGGSNLGFEIGPRGVNAFIPGNGAPVALDSSLFSVATTQTAGTLGLEFSLANSLFTGPIAGLNYSSSQVFPTTGSTIRLNLSQSFGYSVAGGALSYGANRLGVTQIGGEAVAAVPEPANWALMILGFGLAGGAIRRRRATGRIALA